MRLTNRILAIVLAAVFAAATPAFAQQGSIVDQATLSQALAGQAHAEDAQRAQVRRVLQRDDVRAMAHRMGLDLARADSAIAALSGAELDTLAQQARSVEGTTLAGGANTIVISTTTLLLVIIIIILLAK